MKRKMEAFVKVLEKIKLVLINIRFKLDISMPVMITNLGIGFWAWQWAFASASAFRVVVFFGLFFLFLSFFLSLAPVALFVGHEQCNQANEQ